MSSCVETVLLVEDDEMVRTIIADSLRAQGYTVMDACRGDEALLLCECHCGPVHILVTDIMMPGMNGLELAERVIKFHPQIRVLFMSGYAEAGITRDSGTTPRTVFLQKPFRLDVLNRTLREVLDGGR